MTEQQGGGPYVGDIRESDGALWDGKGWVTKPRIPAEAVEAHSYMCPCEEHVKERRELWRIRYADRKKAAARKAQK